MRVPETMKSKKLTKYKIFIYYLSFFIFTDMCFLLTSTPCGSLYPKTIFPNIFNDKDLNAAMNTFKKLAEPILKQNCSSLSLHYLCGLIFPKCDAGFAKFSCNSTCQGKTLFCFSLFFVSFFIPFCQTKMLTHFFCLYVKTGVIVCCILSLF